MTIVLIAALLLAQIAREQGVVPTGAPAATSTLRGRIVRGDDGGPLPRAQVRLVPVDPPAPARLASTDETGAFDFTALRAGSYRLSASKAGYVRLEFGQRRAFEPGVPIVLTAGETRDRADIALPRHGAITGRVVDESGDPVEGAALRVREIRFMAGRRQLVGVDATALPTNELGRYRIFGLQPGRYVVSAEVGHVGTEDLPGYATTYFPGTPNPGEAQLIIVGVAQEVHDIDFPLAPVRTARIAGRTISAAGEPYRGAIELRASLRSGSVVTASVGARTEPDGSFEFPNVPPGEYVVQATRGIEVAWQFVTVNGTDLTGVVVQTQAGSFVRGRVTFEGAGTPNRRQIEIAPLPVDPDLVPFSGGPKTADIRDDWSFEIPYVSGPCRLGVRSPDGWTLKAIRVKGADVTDTPLAFGATSQSLTDIEVVLTDQLTEISGNVTDSRGQPIADYTAIVFAADRRLWYDGSRFFTATRPARDGRFTVRGLPPGDYLVAAVDRIPGRSADAEWQDPQFLDSIASRAVPVTVNEGQRASLNPRLIAR
jgi:Carboxypeptidase regulatory-like domain